MFSKEALDAVKKVDLLTYLESTAPDELVRDGADSYKTRTHGSLSISNGLWFWHSRGFGGKTALDYLIKVEGYSFPDAVKKILGLNISMMVGHTSEKEKRPKILLLPKPYSNNDKAMEYLKKRGIREDVTGPLFEQGLIYESRFIYAGSFREAANIVFLGKDEGGVPRYAGIRGIGTDFKGDAKGSEKKYSFSLYNSKYPGAGVDVFESPIDLLSYASIMHHESCGHAMGHMLSLGGISSGGSRNGGTFPIALSHFLHTHPEIRGVILRFDNDISGRLAANQLTEALKGKYTVVDSPPKRGKDYNDYLRIKYSGESEYVQRSRCYER